MAYSLCTGGSFRRIVRLGVAVALLVAAASSLGPHLLLAGAPPRYAGVAGVQAQPLQTDGQQTQLAPVAPPDHLLLDVPFTTQAPLNDWAQHQESCEAANLTMLWFYWNQSGSVVIDPHEADAYIRVIDSWKPQPDLNDELMGELAAQHWGYTYRILPNTPEVIAQEIAAGRPLLAEVRTHGLGNPHYPGYYSHYEQTGWSVPHFVLIIGYDGSGVWLNDPGISLGRGYHITYAQLAHAIDDLDQHEPNLAEGQALLLIAPVAQARTPREIS